MKVVKTAKIEGYRRYALVSGFGITLEQVSLLKAGVIVDLSADAVKKLSELELIVTEVKLDSKKTDSPANGQEVKRGV